MMMDLHLRRMQILMRMSLWVGKRSWPGLAPQYAINRRTWRRLASTSHIFWQQRLPQMLTRLMAAMRRLATRHRPLACREQRE